MMDIINNYWVIITIMGFGFIFLVMFILGYIFSSLAIYRFMQNRNLDNAFFAWIPVLSSYALGKIYDDINKENGKKTNCSIIMLTVSSLDFLLPLLMSIFSFSIYLCYWPLSLTYVVLELICYQAIFKQYIPNNSTFFVLTIIFSIVPIVPFIPGFCLLKASKNQPVSLKNIN